MLGRLPVSNVHGRTDVLRGTFRLSLFFAVFGGVFQWNSWNGGQKKGATNLGFGASRGGVLKLDSATFQNFLIL